MILPIVLIIVLFIVGVLIIYVNPFIERKTNEKYNKRCQDSISVLKNDTFTSSFYNFPKKILIKVEGDKANINTPYVDIKEECVVNELTLDGVKQIINLNVKAQKIVFTNSDYKEADGVIFDKDDSVCFIYKRQTINKLKELAKNYNIRRTVLKDFSNAKYVQFTSKGALRISHPFKENEGIIKLVCPKRIEGVLVNTLEINYHNVDYIYINDQIKLVIYEVDCNIRRIDLEKSKYLKVRNNQLVYRKYNLIVSNNAYSRKIDKNSLKNRYVLPFVFTKKITFCRKEKER